VEGELIEQEEGSSMHVVVVYESLYGNTREVAEAVARGIADARPDAVVEVFPVGEAHEAHAATADFLIVGGPTHIRGMTSGLSRHLGVAAEEKKEPSERHHLEPGAEGPGLRDWFGRLPHLPEPRPAAAFDTRIGARFAGAAAPAIAHRLHRHGYAVLGEPEGFLVQDDGTGPLQDGELTRARTWGVDLARRAAPIPAS
jgi:hypothetical protein